MSNRGALQDPLARFRRSFDAHPLARETVVSLLAMVGLFAVVVLVRGPYRVLQDLVPDLGPGLYDFAASGAVAALTIVLALALASTAYVRYRAVPVGGLLPARVDLPPVAALVLAPVALVALVDLVAAATGTTVAALTEQSVAEGALVVPAVVSAVGLLLSVPVMVIVSQVIVQSSLRQAADGRTAIALTTALVGLPTTWSPGMVLSPGVVVFAAFVVVPTAVAVLTHEVTESRWLRGYAALSLLGVAAIAVASVVMDVESVAGGAHTLATLAVVALAAWGYERTDSLLVSALVYATFQVALDAVVVLFEAGPVA